MALTSISSKDRAAPRIDGIESFFERVESKPLAQAIKQRGYWAKVPVGEIKLKVPCNYSLPDNLPY